MIIIARTVHFHGDRSSGCDGHHQFIGLRGGTHSRGRECPIRNMILRFLLRDELEKDTMLHQEWIWVISHGLVTG